MKLSKFILSTLFFICSCVAGQKRVDAINRQKIVLDLNQMDDDGLFGPENGKVSKHYEFCIPAEEKYWKVVHQIDPTSGKMPSKGRIGCSDGTWLILGNTHQKGAREVLYQLASQPFIDRIEETVWE